MSCGCVDFNEGDWVECSLDTNLFGIIISDADFGRYYNVQLAGSLEVRAFHWATISHIDDPEDEGGGTSASMPTDDNVINFTRERDLRTAKTKGAA